MEIRFQVQPQQLRRLLGVAFVLEVALALMFAVSRLDGMPLTIFDLFNFDGEVSLPTWFSAAQLLLIGLTFLLWSALSQGQTVVSRWLLITLGACFIFLSADEAAMIHERLTPMFKSVDWLPRFRGDRGLWIPLYLMAVALFFIKFRRDFLRLAANFPKPVRTIVLGALLFLLGAVGLEVLNYQFELEAMANHWPHTFQILFEELFEMAGASLMLYGVFNMALEALNGVEQAELNLSPVDRS